MAPDERGEVGDVLVADVHAVPSQLSDGFLHVDGIPMYDGIEGEAKAAKLFFLPLLKRASDFTALAMADTPAEAMTQFRVIELGQDAAAERRIVDIVQDVNCLGDPADFGECPGQSGWLIFHLQGLRGSDFEGGLIGLSTRFVIFCTLACQRGGFCSILRGK
jgi:hypothetical protein